MTDAISPSRRRTCPNCGSRARVAGNPYYGVGLAVHSHLWSCTRCQSVGFVGMPKAPAESDAGDSERLTPERRPRRGFARVVGFVSGRAMEDIRFEGRDEWIAAVDRALSHPDASPLLAAKALDRGVVLTVAQFEASHASVTGVSTLSHARLAQLAGLPRSVVLRARLALIELGLEDLASAPGAHLRIRRELRHR